MELGEVLLRRREWMRKKSGVYKKMTKIHYINIWNCQEVSKDGWKERIGAGSKGKNRKGNLMPGSSEIV